MIIFRLNVLILVSFEKLRLGILMLLILRLVVAKLTIEFIESIFLFLDDLVAFLNLH